MGLSIAERKQKLIEDVCASCSGGGADAAQGGGGDYAGEAGEGGDYGELMKGLDMIKKTKSKRKAKVRGT